MKNSRVYSYLRFSDPKQAAGTSADRQTEYAARWAAERGLSLDASLSLRDEGLSAYHQKHVKQGALGAFLLAIDEGRIPSGSVLIVEALDRLSRAEPIMAQAQLAQIINAGITVVTASDGREYNFERLKAQPMDLVYSLLVMIRAHEESDTKSKRVKAALRRQCIGWIAGTFRGQIGGTKTDPGWVVKSADGSYSLHPEASLAVRAMVDLMMKGYGAPRILDTLNERGLFVMPGSPNQVDRFRQIANRRTLIGEKTLEIDGETYNLPGYYPALLTEHEFAELQHVIAQRGRKPGRSQIPALFTGMGIARCGYCGAPLVSQNGFKQRARKENGLPHDGHRRLVCTSYKGAIKCAVGGSCSVVPIERALMNYCSDQINLNSLLSGDSSAHALHRRLSLARTNAADIERKIHRVTDALLSDDGDTPVAIVRRIRDLESELTRARHDIDALENELAATPQTPAAADAWAELAKGVEQLDYDSRLKARNLVAETFSQVVVYRAGLDVGVDESSIALTLVAKRGTARNILIDRISGEWRAADEIDHAVLEQIDAPSL